MASIERTAYPRFRRVVSARELADVTPTADDVAWARQLSRTDEHLLVLVLSLRCFGRLGYFPRSGDVPAAVVDHVRRCLELEDGTAAVCGTATAKLHRTLVRERLGVVCDPQRARAVAQDAIAGAALVKNHPPDLINVALELLVKASLELPGFAMLDELAARIRHDVNTAMFERVGARIALPDRIALEGLLDVAGPGAKSAFHRLKQAAGRASWSAFREQVAHLRWVDSLLRYVLTTFTYGANMGPAQAARHIRGVSAHELGATAARHFSTAKLNRASADVVNAYLQLDLVTAWGDATSVAADGTHVDTLIDNLLAESHIRYGGYGGIAYHHVADNYIALFSHFIPCGVWEAVYIIEGLLKNESEAEPGTIHADTQGQSYPVHALAHLFGFELLTRIRNWKDLTFYRPTADVSYAHIDALFGPAGENAINWQLIQTHWSDLMQIALSIRAGNLSSALLLRRLGTDSRKNNIYKAFRELGRVIRTITLLRFVSEPGLRQEITAATNKAEAFNGFSAWLRFGHDAIERNDPAEQEKIIKFNTLLANCVIFHTALDMTAVLRALAAEGWDLTAAALGSLSPYLTEPIKRFGEYATDGLTIPPAAFDSRLNLPPRSREIVSSAGMAA